MIGFVLAVCLLMCLIAILYICANGDFQNPDLTCLCHVVVLGLIVVVMVRLVLLIVQIGRNEPITLD